MPDNSGFSKRLREVIGDKKISDFADRIGVSRPYVYKMLKTGKLPRLPVVMLICVAGGVTERWLRTGKGERKANHIPLLGYVSAGGPGAPAEAGDDDVLTAHLARLESEGAIDKSQAIVGGFLVTVQGPIGQPPPRKPKSRQKPPQPL